MDYTAVREKVEHYAQLVTQVLHPKMIVVYGSYVKGTAREESDIDIAVIYDKGDGEYWETFHKLYQLRRGIDNRIEPVLLEYGNNASGFYEEVLQHGLVIYAT